MLQLLRSGLSSRHSDTEQQKNIVATNGPHVNRPHTAWTAGSCRPVSLHCMHTSLSSIKIRQSCCRPAATMRSIAAFGSFSVLLALMRMPFDSLSCMTPWEGSSAVPAAAEVDGGSETLGLLPSTGTKLGWCFWSFSCSWASEMSLSGTSTSALASTCATQSDQPVPEMLYSY